jgi:hypothetical protein
MEQKKDEKLLFLRNAHHLITPPPTGVNTEYPTEYENDDVLYTSISQMLDIRKLNKCSTKLIKMSFDLA